MQQKKYVQHIKSLLQESLVWSNFTILCAFEHYSSKAGLKIWSGLGDKMVESMHNNKHVICYGLYIFL